MSHRMATIMGIKYLAEEPIQVESLAHTTFMPVYSSETIIIGVIPTMQIAYEVMHELRAISPHLTGVFHFGPIPPTTEYLINTTIQRCIYLLNVLQPGRWIITQPAYLESQSTFEQAGHISELGLLRLPDLLPPSIYYELLESELDAAEPIRSLDHYTHNLPIQSSAFLGREQVLADLEGQLQQPDRLISLTGPSGIGKTRLALQLAARVLANFPDGVYFIACAPLTEAQAVLSAIAQTLAIEETVNEVLEQTIYRSIKYKRLLLILDNTEQITGIDSVLQRILEHTDYVKVLQTTQLSHQVSEERVFNVPPFSLPDPDNLPDLETFECLPVIALFLNRAHEVQPMLRLDNLEAQTVARICQLIEGLPITVELIAAQVDHYTLPEIYEQLSTHLAQYQECSNTRERIINPVLEWIIQSFDQSTQYVFARLGVFADGFTIDGAEAICYQHGQIVEDVTNELMTLLNHNLVFFDEALDGMSRYIMLDCIHDFAQHLCQHFAEWEMIQERYVQYYRDVAIRTESLLRGEHMLYWSQWLNTQYHNINVALTYGIQNRQIDDVLNLASAFGRFWMIRAQYHSGSKWLEQILAFNEASSEARSKAYTALGTLYFLQGRLDEAEHAFLQGLELQSATEDYQQKARILNNMGAVEAARGNFQKATEWFEQNLSLLREAGDQQQIADAINNLGVIAYDQGAYTEALTYYQESLDLARASGDVNSIAISLANLGEVSLLNQAYSEAEHFLQESRDLARKTGNIHVVADAQLTLGWLAFEQEQFKSAQQFMQDSIRIRIERNDVRGLALSLDGLAAVLSAQTKYTAAAQLLGCAHHIRETQDIALGVLDVDRIETIKSHVQAESSPEQWVQYWELGQHQEPVSLLQNLDIIL